MEKSLKRMATMHKMQVTGLELFYRKGYYNTSVDEILKELSLSKGAFYYHFKSKEDFFISILQQLVVRKIYSMLIEPIEGHDNPLDLISSCLDESLQTAEHNENDYGFVLSNFITEFNGKNPEIMKYLNDTLKIWEVNLVSALQRGKFNGFVDRHVDCEGAASYIISSYIGIRTMMVEGSATALRYRYMQQVKFFFRAMANKQTA
ncbi:MULTISPECIES: TetR/AcrR family transcriptional regulator [Cellulophaga]|uniref:TetR/AcrR family transcriptional regulator n=1 Tax=Cellulophaga TaxID=104264 RepID=UPI000405728D|nr:MULTISPECIES: TetR/AcrR family transcriptional regulator [Cellulophaga]AIY12704.1 transcriptional regulator [Cellulophaga baltica NN016038]KGK30424.1 transcriptional regulator [Cellulophaga sp. E6(2014)]MBA6313771.1 TetR/AcrR family transcriptional regulator [Cellulophaga baltica]QXP51166.1 TetR/AcrR family transcriptional regulator [Cellulophaga sp. HaHa_2_1]